MRFTRGLDRLWELIMDVMEKSYVDYFEIKDKARNILIQIPISWDVSHR